MLFSNPIIILMIIIIITTVIILWLPRIYILFWCCVVIGLSNVNAVYTSFLYHGYLYYGLRTTDLNPDVRERLKLLQ